MPKAAAAQPSSSPKTLQIFKPGRFTAMSGVEFAFSEVDLAATARAYKPELHQAPLVVGHPKHDHPAYGWVKSVAFAGGGLEATPEQVNPEFAAMVDSGAFRNMSAAFYAPDAPGNPVPGVYYLRHVGFLGAMPPAVRGLRSPSFAADEEGVVEFSEWDDVTNASLWRSLREWFIGKFGQDEADRVVPQYRVQTLEEGAQAEVIEARQQREATTTTMGFSEGESDVTEAEQRAALLADNARLQAELKRLQDSQRAARGAAAHAEHVAFCEGLVSQGRLPKAHQAAAVAVLDDLVGRAEEAGAAVEFGEGDQRAPLAPAVRQLLEQMPVRVEFGEHATGERAAGDQVGNVEFAAPPGATVSAEGMALHRKVQAYQANHPGTDYVAALAAVQAGRT